MNKTASRICYIVSVAMLLSSVYAISSRLKLDTEKTITLLGTGAALLSALIALMSLNRTLRFNKSVAYYEILNRQLLSLVKLNRFISKFGDIHFLNSLDHVPYKESLSKLKHYYDSEEVEYEIANAGERAYLAYFELKEHIEQRYDYYVFYDNEVALMESYALYQEITELHNSFVNIIAIEQEDTRIELEKNHPNKI